MLKATSYWQVMLQTARFLRQEGDQLELVLRVRLGQNASFAFLKPGSPLHDYYRWLVHAEPQVCGSSLSGPSQRHTQAALIRLLSRLCVHPTKVKGSLKQA